MEGHEKYKGVYRVSTARAQWHDYNGGAYFVTICTKKNRHYFGEIESGEMRLNEIGRFAEECIAKIPEIHPEFVMERWVVMPNHVHILLLSYKPDDLCAVNHYSSLARVVQAFKSVVTKYANRNGIKFSWQSRFHDRIVRNRHELQAIERYIVENVQNWETDRNNLCDVM